MSHRRLVIAAMAGAMLMLCGCSHRLQATPGEHTVRVYPDEATFEKLKSLKGEGGAAGMIGGLGENLVAREVADHTPVRIISQDSQGAEIEITDGPNKGSTGFVAKQNLD